jgi:hypothetical protein
VGELADELPKAAGALATAYLVRTVLLEAAGGLPFRKPLPPGTEVAE